MMKPFTESVGGFHGRGYRERGNINTPLELADGAVWTWPDEGSKDHDGD